MEDFLKNFKNNMENRPEPSFEERDWRSMESRLESQSKNRSGFIWWWAALPILMFLLMSNAYFYFEFSKTNDKLTSFEQYLETSYLITDTVFLTKHIYLTDTIYQTRTIIKYLPAIANTEQSIVSEKSQPINKLNEKDLTTESGQTMEFPSNDSGLNIPTLVDFLALTEFPATLPILNLPEEPFKPTVKKKTLPQVLYQARPKSVGMGLSGGGAIANSDDLNPLGGFSIGLEAIVDFSDKWQSWADAAYYNIKFSSDKMDDGIGIPAVSPPTADYTLNAIELPRPSLLLSIGVQRNFNINGKLKPFAGIGIGASQLLAHQITYDFMDKNNGIEFIFEKEIKKSSIQYGDLLLKAGILHGFSNNWQLSLQAVYRNSLDQINHQTPTIFGLQAVVLRKF